MSRPSHCVTRIVHCSGGLCAAALSHPARRRRPTRGSFTRFDQQCTAKVLAFLEHLRAAGRTPRACLPDLTRRGVPERWFR